MIKRVLAAALCLIMVFALLPKTARAASPASVYIWKKELDATNKYYKNGENGEQGTYGTASDWNARYENGVLTLKNLNVAYQPDNFLNSGIYADANGGADVTLIIMLEGDNRVSTKDYDDGNNFAIYASDCSLAIQGQGQDTLTTIAGKVAGSNNISFGVYAGRSITVTDCSLTGTGDEATKASYGVCAEGAITVESGSITGTGGTGTGNTSGQGSFGVYAGSDITAITGGTIAGTGVQSSADSYGVYAGNAITADGGTITGTGTAGLAGMRSCGVYAGKAITADGGTITGTGGAAGNQSYGVYLSGTGTGVEIKNNGTIKGTGGATNDVSTGVVSASTQTKLSSGRLVGASTAGNALDIAPSLPNVYYWRTGKSDGYTEKNGTQGQAYQYSSTHTYVDIRTGLPAAITFSTHPVSTKVTQGSITGSLTAAANASPGDEVTLNWYACDAGGTPTGSSLGTGGAFAIPTTLIAGTYYYLCRASSSGATLNSNVATVTVNAPTIYEITKGQHGQWFKGSGVGLGFTSNGDYSKFINGGSVTVDGMEIANSNYTSQSGSTIVTLNAAYLETLTAGWHTLRVNFTDGYAETNFFINAAGGAGGDVGPDVPKTGDSATPVLWLGLMLLAGVGFAVRRKRAL